MTQLAHELAACPFCGGEAQLCEDPDDSGPRVNCLECDMEGPRAYWTDYLDKSDAFCWSIERWNTRPALRAKPAGEVDGAASFAHSFVLLNSGNVELAEGVRDYILARTRPAASPAPDSALGAELAARLAAVRKNSPASNTIPVTTTEAELLVAALRQPAPRADDALRERFADAGEQNWEYFREISTPAPFHHNEQVWKIKARLFAKVIARAALASDAPTDDKGD